MSASFGWARWWVSVVIVTWSASAQAQTPCHHGCDEVVLSSGETLAGIIAEYAPDGAVTLVLPSGETRRFAPGEVRSVVLAEARNDVDAARGSPLPLASTPRFAGRRVRVRLRTEDDIPLALSIETRAYRPDDGSGDRRTDTSLLTGYRLLCTLPCDAMVPEGSQLFGVARPGEDPVTAEALTLIRGATTVVAHLEERTGVRILGLVVAILGAVGAGALAIAGAVQEDPTMLFRLVGAAALVALSFGVTGAVLMWTPDRAEVRAR